MILQRDNAIFTGRRGHGQLAPKVEEIDRLAVPRYLFPQLSLLVFWVIVVVHALEAIPGCSQQVIFGLFVVFVDIAPVNEGRYEFLLRVLCLGWLGEFLHPGSVLDIEAVDTAALIANKQLPVTLVHTHACDVLGSSVSKDSLERAVSGVPNLDAARMRRDKGVENWVVEDADTGLVIGQVVVRRFVVVKELHRSSTRNDTLGWLRNCHAVNFVQRTVESLDGCECTHIPDSKHA